MDELVCSSFRPESVAYFQKVIARMKDQGCDAVVLGCTELEMIVDVDANVLPIYDCTRIHAEAAVEWILGG